MSSRNIRSVAVIGAGPAGSMLAAVLARRGLAVRLYRQPQRPKLIVGESLVPAVIPLLRLLELEERVAAFSVFKPGAILSLYPDRVEWRLEFGRLQGVAATYAYNVPRDTFDALLLERAAELGVEIINARARVQKAEEHDCVRLADVEVDFIVDASGRNRVLAQLLNIASERGARDDVALFAHMQEMSVPNPGYLHMNILEDGWCWRIPLQERLSLGFVVPRAHLQSLGQSKQEQFDRLRESDPLLRDSSASAVQVSEVMRYDNYQLLSTRMQGRNWAMIGDAAGFLDPVFSSGLHLALSSAVDLADTLCGNGIEGLPAYERRRNAEFQRWAQLIESFYDRRFFSLVRFARKFGEAAVHGIQSGHTLGLLLSGYEAAEDNSGQSLEWFLGFCHEQAHKLRLLPEPLQ